jgi:hypothetical protein
MSCSVVAMCITTRTPPNPYREGEETECDVVFGSSYVYYNNLPVIAPSGSKGFPPAECVLPDVRPINRRLQEATKHSHMQASLKRIHEIRISTNGGLHYLY